MSLPVPERGALPEGRIALLFTDIEGSTALLHALGDAYGSVLDAHDRLLRQVFDEFGGVEVDNEGDGFFVVFADLDRAVAAARAAQARLDAEPWPGGKAPRVRMALHAGQPRVRGRRYWGIDVNYASRLCMAAHGGQVLLSASMRSAVPDERTESLGEHGLKDFATPRELFHLVLEAPSGHVFPPPRTLSVVRTNLPSVTTSIIGREAQIAEVFARIMVTGERLVTLIGRGGVGKTRLAIACAERLAPMFEEGVVFTPLASVADVEAAIALIAGAAGAGHVDGDAAKALRGHLADRHALLVLDNAEHLPGLGTLVARLLEADPQLSVLVTSQVPLGIRGECLVRIEPLTAGPAAQLFAERVHAQDPSFFFDDENARSVEELCAAVEGIPLALELAAARSAVVGVDALVDVLRRNPDALGAGSVDLPPRQRGMRAALDWTVSLLGQAERLVFEGLGAFASAWTLEQVEHLFADDLGAMETWDALSRLVDFSLVAPRGDGRFTMPERVRRHAQELLSASGREHEWCRRHAVLMADAMDRRGLEIAVDLLRVTANVDDAFEETAHALTWARSHDPSILRRLLATSAVPFSYIGRMAVIAPDLMALDLGTGCADREAGYLLLGQALVHGMGMQDSAAQLEAARAATDCLSSTGLPEDVFVTINTELDALLSLERFDDARERADELVRLAAAASDERWLELARSQYLPLAVGLGDIEWAEECLAQIARRPGRTDTMAVFADSYRGDCAFLRGDYAQAVGFYAASLNRVPSTQLDNSLYQVQGAAAALAGMGTDDLAVELLASIDEVYRTRTGRAFAFFTREYEPPITAARRRLGPHRSAEVEERGRMTGYDALRQRTADIAAELSG